jgi:protein-tyrosine kinase
MSRIEEALRRAAKAPALPDAAAPPDVGALSFFHADERDLRPAPAPRPEVPAAPGRAIPRAWVGKIVLSDEIKDATVEQYRRLAAALHQAQSSTGCKVVLLTSAVAGEGKTLTAANLALTLSESYERRVLLIDADFRRPSLHDLFQVPNVSGLNECLTADADRKLTIVDLSPRLSLVPAGRPNQDPMGGLTSGRMQRIVAEAAARFDWVLLDTPPVGLITDANLLATMTDVAVLVVQANRTPCALIQRSIESVGRERIIGVVLNQMDERASVLGGKYGQYYSSYLTARTNGSAMVGT